MTTLTLQPGLRPAQLPPTLQPHAVLSVAPPTDRRRSAAISAMVYAILGGGLFWLARAGAVVAVAPPQPMGPVVVFDPAPMVATPATPHAIAPPKMTDVPAIAPPANNLETPVAMPSRDMSHDPPVLTATSPVSNPADGPGTTSGPISLSGDAVRVLYQVNPVYPPLAKMAHQQGQVVIRMTIDERGLPSDVQAVSGIPTLQAPALKAARQWRFEPARQNGQPVAATFLLTLNFVLR
jgi:protein TonB